MVIDWPVQMGSAETRDKRKDRIFIKENGNCVVFFPTKLNIISEFLWEGLNLKFFGIEIFIIDIFFYSFS